MAFTDYEDGLRVYSSPEVTLICRPQYLAGNMQDAAGKPVSKYWRYSDVDIPGGIPPAQALVEAAGRACYQSFNVGRDPDAYFENILESAHGSVLEHANWSFYLQGVSRSLTHELVRHRAGMGVSQLSQRYVDASDTAFVMPPAIQEFADGSEPWEVFLEACRIQKHQYTLLTEQLAAKGKERYPDSPTDARKWARQAARCVLGNHTETKLVVTANARALRHILEMRGSPHAEAEIRALALALLALLKPEAPLLFGDYAIQPDGSIAGKYRKV